MYAAIAAVEWGQLTQNGAAERYNVTYTYPKELLKKMKRDKTIRRNSVINEAQETDVVNKIIKFANIRMLVTPKLIRRQIFIICGKYDLKIISTKNCW